MSLEIKVTRLAARMVDVEGRQTDAAFFLHSVGLHATREESLGERLNEDGCRFLPCDVDGKKRLVSVGRIAYIEIAGSTADLDDHEQAGAHHTPFDALLVTGEHLSGELVHESPPTSNRLSDVLNRPGGRFVLAVRAGHTLYLNREAIASVRL